MISKLREFELPLRSPLETAAGTIRARRGHLVESKRDGARGIGEATPLAGWTESERRCRESLRETLPAENARTALEALDDAPAARHGVSLALCDLEATIADEPAYRWLGATEPVSSVPVNATIGAGSVEDCEAAARDALDAGFGTIKVKVGARGVAEDAARLDAVREVVGPDVELRVDANGSWTPEKARRAIDAFPELEYVEQPCPVSELAAHAALRERTTVALDESVAEQSLEAVLDADAADVVVLKPMVLGGIERSHEAGKRAEAAGVDPVVSTTIDGAVARTAAVHLAATLQPTRANGLATGELLQTDVATAPTRLADGRTSVPQSSGLGVSVPA